MICTTFQMQMLSFSKGKFGRNFNISNKNETNIKLGLLWLQQGRINRDVSFLQ